ncbi:BQ2448_1944 [Microbotryum intermedium]|uniref:BQ2448_1944 protein n=1 Tax=Microbotryum intermedium TaxID=269621 RepID=A0A238FAL4_9BASI|nr:BQ2448_1944 [Microbotryum intermedium]
MLSQLRLLYLRALALVGLSGRVEIVHHQTPRVLVRIDPTTGDKIKTGLDEVIKRCKSLSGDGGWYTPTAWLSSGHLATIWCTIAKFDYDHLVYSRHTIRVPDGGTLCLDITPPISSASPIIDEQPILVVCHGLTGGSHESYVRDVLMRVTKPKYQGGLGWRGLVLNSRGCAGTPVTSAKLYSGGTTDDLRCALAFLGRLAPQAPLYGIGFSLGANQLAKYLGLEGERSALKAGVVLGAPWDFVDGHVVLSSSWLRLIYSRAMAKNLRRILKPHRALFEPLEEVDWDAIYGNPHQTLYEFDSLFTGPVFGFRSGVHYYRWASANQDAPGIAVPTLTFSAKDDPVVASATVPVHLAQLNPNLVFARTDHGGHLGWFEGFFRPRRWISKPVVEFLSEVEKADDGLPRRPAEIVGAKEGAVIKRPQVGDEMVLVKGMEEKVGFKLIQEELHDEAVAPGSEALDLTNGI